MDKYTIAPPAGSTNNSVGAADRPWHEGHFDSVKLNGGDLGEYLAESTGYGIVSGCEPSISGLAVTVGAGVVHLADGTRKEFAETSVTLDAADSTNPRIDLVYIDSTGTVAKITGTAAASPSAPTLPSGGISVAQVSVAAGASTGVVTDSRDMLPRWYNTGIVNVKDFGAKGDGVTDDTSAFEAAFANNVVIIPPGNYYLTKNVISKKTAVIYDYGLYVDIKPCYTQQGVYDLHFANPEHITYKQLDAGMDSCQGFCYVDSLDKFVYAEKNSNDTAQVLHICNKDTLSVEESYNFTLLRHANSITFNPDTNKIYVLTGNNTTDNTCSVAVLDVTDLSAIESTFTLPILGTALAWDRVCKCYALMGYPDSEWGNIYIYDKNFNLISQFEYDYENLTTNGLLANNGIICFFYMYGAYTYDYCGNILSMSKTQYAIENEDADICDGNIYIVSNNFSANSNSLIRFSKTNKIYDYNKYNTGITFTEVNCNQIIQSGVYRLTTSDYVRDNFPSDTVNIFLKVTKIGGYVLQEAYRIPNVDNVDKFTRIYISGAWTNWHYESKQRPEIYITDGTMCAGVITGGGKALMFTIPNNTLNPLVQSSIKSGGFVLRYNSQTININPLATDTSVTVITTDNSININLTKQTEYISNVNNVPVSIQCLDVVISND